MLSEVLHFQIRSGTNLGASDTAINQEKDYNENNTGWSDSLRDYYEGLLQNGLVGAVIFSYLD